jgi:hypothetical protein
MKLRVGLVGLAVALAFLMVAALPSVPASLETFRRSYGGAGADVAQGIVVGSDGTIYMTGSTNSYGPNPPNLYLSIFNSDNSHRCSVAVDLGGSEEGSALRLHGGKLYVAGHTSAGSNPPNIVVARLDANCNLEVLKLIDLGGQEVSSSIAVEPSSPPNFYIAGSQTTLGAFILKLDSSLDAVWAKIFKVSSGGDVARAVEFSGGKLYVAGTAVDSLGDTNAFLSLFDPAGNHVGTRLVSSANSDEGIHIAVRGGDVYIAGSTFFPGRNLEALVAKFDTSLNAQWIRVLGTASGNEAGRAVAVTDTGLVYVAGWTSFLGSPDVLLLALSGTGAISHAFAVAAAGPLTDLASSAYARSGCVYAAGQNTNWPLFYVALDAESNPVSMTISSPTPSIASAAAVVSSPTPTLAPFSPSLDSTASPDVDALYLKFCPDTLLVATTTTSTATQTTTLATTITATSTTTAYQIATTTLTSVERVTTTEKTTTTIFTTQTQVSTVYVTSTSTTVQTTTTAVTSTATSYLTATKSETVTVTYTTLFAEPVSTYVLPALLVLIAGLLAATLITRRRRRLFQY